MRGRPARRNRRLSRILSQPCAARTRASPRSQLPPFGPSAGTLDPCCFSPLLSFSFIVLASRSHVCFTLHSRPHRRRCRYPDTSFCCWNLLIIVPWRSLPQQPLKEQETSERPDLTTRVDSSLWTLRSEFVPYGETARACGESREPGAILGP